MLEPSIFKENVKVFFNAKKPELKNADDILLIYFNQEQIKGIHNKFSTSKESDSILHKITGKSSDFVISGTLPNAMVENMSVHHLVNNEVNCIPFIVCKMKGVKCFYNKLQKFIARKALALNQL